MWGDTAKASEARYHKRVHKKRLQRRATWKLPVSVATPVYFLGSPITAMIAPRCNACRQCIWVYLRSPFVVSYHTRSKSAACRVLNSPTHNNNECRCENRHPGERQGNVQDEQAVHDGGHADTQPPKGGDEAGPYQEGACLRSISVCRAGVVWWCVSHA